MRIRLALLALVLVAALPFTACAQDGPGEVTWEIPLENFVNQPHPESDEVEVLLGDTFRLILGSNPTTGYQWSENARIENTALLKQVSHEYVAPENGMPGAAGKDVWEFEATQKGVATVSLEYRRPWESDSEDGWSYKVAVNIK